LTRLFVHWPDGNLHPGESVLVQEAVIDLGARAGKD